MGGGVPCSTEGGLSSFTVDGVLYGGGRLRRLALGGGVAGVVKGAGPGSGGRRGETPSGHPYLAVGPFVKGGVRVCRGGRRVADIGWPSGRTQVLQVAEHANFSGKDVLLYG